MKTLPDDSPIQTPSKTDEIEAAQDDTTRAKCFDWANGAAGFVFMAAGAFKWLAPQSPGFAGGARGFGQALSTLHVPLAAFFGYAIPLLEIAGGAVLCGSLVARRFRKQSAMTRRNEIVERVVCALLACDMMAAIATVGVPGALGHPLRVGETQIGSEAWRLPLEIVLLWLTARRALQRPA